MWRAPLVALLWLAGCGHSIGDPCRTNVDCSPTGTRFCDTSALNGYCTQENCGVDSCPGNSVCIRFFTPVVDEPCNYDVYHPFSCPHTDERCVCDRTDAMGACSSFTTNPDGSVTNGHCASSATERRWCQLRCSSNSDCRQGYECRSTGTFGAEPVPTFDMATGDPAKFCAPTGSTF
jgi:hypothetical protein